MRGFSDKRMRDPEDEFTEVEGKIRKNRFLANELISKPHYGSTAVTRATVMLIAKVVSFAIKFL